MNVSSLHFNRDGKAEGFGRNAPCPFTGERGDNASVAAYTYDKDKGELSISFTRRDMAHGNHLESVYPDLVHRDPPLKMTFAEAVAFATVVDTALTAMMKDKNPSAEAFNNVPIQNSNELKGLLAAVVVSAEMAMIKPRLAEEDIGNFFNELTASLDVPFHKVKRTKFEHLQETMRLTVKDGSDPKLEDDPLVAVYVCADNGQISVWKGRSEEGAWVSFDDNPHGRNEALACIAEALGVKDETKSKLSVRSAATVAAQECGVTLSMPNQSKGQLAQSGPAKRGHTSELRV